MVYFVEVVEFVLCMCCDGDEGWGVVLFGEGLV